MLSVDIIDEQELEDSLGGLSVHAAGEQQGLYGPNSMTWRVSGEAMLFAGSWRAALLQLAHPWVAQSILEHSSTTQDPVGRFHRTFQVVFSMMYGNLECVRRVSRALHGLHAGITGSMPGGKGYAANGHRAMTWVLATLWDTSLRMHDVWVRPLREGEKDAYVREGSRFARCFGIDPDEMPATWSGLQEWMQGWIARGEVEVSPIAAELGRFLFAAPQIPLGRIIFPLARKFTSMHLPDRLREGFGLPRAGRWEEAAWSSLAASFRLTRHLVPTRIRWLPVYFEAMERLAGRCAPARMTRLLNRLWVGRPELVFASRPRV